MNSSPALLERKFSGLVSKLQAGDCVLVLGPRITAPTEVAGADVAIDDYLAGKLLEDLGAEESAPLDLRAAIARYERDRSASACRSLVQGLISEFDSHCTDLHRDFAALPFRLVLSAAPDRMMAEAFRAVGKVGVRQALYNFCPNGSHSDAALALPTVERPIVYSLFGRHDQMESMVLNDKNLLDYLVRVTRESPALPDSVRATLRSPSTVFLFVGFGFTNWWLRLLLQVLEITGVENRGISLALEDSRSFDAGATVNSKGFFESLGIYIQSRDWIAMARDLRARLGPSAVAPAPPAESGRAAATVPFAADDGGDTRRARPLVFLSYASDDVDRVEALAAGLLQRGVAVWQDKQNLRAGQLWMDQIARLIRDVDYFVFVQTQQMDERDLGRRDGVYNRELKLALERAKDKPYGTAFVFHVTIGDCRQRPEPELGEIHHIAIDHEVGIDRLTQDILESYRAALGAIHQGRSAVLQG